jgi:hypothetical protein
MFIYAYPDITKLEFGDTARDFSAYYLGAWRLLHNPTMVYHDGGLPSDYALTGIPQPFKYTPSFLILMLPFLAVNYMDALVTFNFLQLALIPLLAFFVYKLGQQSQPSSYWSSRCQLQHPTYHSQNKSISGTST